jgi:hypothetical protein
MQRPVESMVQRPAKPPAKGCAGCMLCAAGRIQPPPPIKISAGRNLAPRSLLARCVGG